MSKTNNKLFAGLMAAAVAVAPVTALANDEVTQQAPLKQGVYFTESNEFYTTTELAELVTSNPQKLMNLLSGDKSKIVLVLPGIPNPITLSQTTAKDGKGIYEESTNNPAEVPAGEYTTASGEPVVVDETPEENLNETFFYNLAA